MVAIERKIVEAEIFTAIDEVNRKFNMSAEITTDFCPGNSLPSQILVTLMVRIGEKLGVVIPDNCYIFHDGKERKQLSIKEAVSKLLKMGKNGN